VERGRAFEGGNVAPFSRPVVDGAEPLDRRRREPEAVADLEDGGRAREVPREVDHVGRLLRVHDDGAVDDQRRVPGVRVVDARRRGQRLPLAARRELRGGRAQVPVERRAVRHGDGRGAAGRRADGLGHEHRPRPPRAAVLEAEAHAHGHGLFELAREPARVEEPRPREAPVAALARRRLLRGRRGALAAALEEERQRAAGPEEPPRLREEGGVGDVREGVVEHAVELAGPEERRVLLPEAQERRRRRRRLQREAERRVEDAPVRLEDDVLRGARAEDLARGDAHAEADLEHARARPARDARERLHVDRLVGGHDDLAAETQHLVRRLEGRAAPGAVVRHRMEELELPVVGDDAAVAAGAAVGDGRRGVFAAADDDGRGNREECERMHAARCKSHRRVQEAW